MSMIKPCTCKNAYQDEKYGNGKRVMNKTVTGYRCTVCATAHADSGGKGK